MEAPLNYRFTNRLKNDLIEQPKNALESAKWELKTEFFGSRNRNSVLISRLSVGNQDFVVTSNFSRCNRILS